MSNKKQLRYKPSEFVENFIRFQGYPVSFEKWPHSKMILDLERDILYVMGARQISKSKGLSWDSFAEMSVPYNSELYLAPSIPQAKAFSNDSIRTRINESPKFRDWYTDPKTLLNNVFEKEYVPGSKQYFRAASQLENIRGLTAKRLKFDEVQDITRDVFIIVTEVATAQEDVKITYAGTAKTFSNYSASLWKQSSKISPIIKCSSNPPHYNIPDEDNIAPEGLICKTCKTQMFIESDNVLWTPLGDPDARITGVWIPQIAIPLHVNNPKKWSELYYKKCTYPSVQFRNEILGVPAGTGLFGLTEDDIEKCCFPEFEMWEESKECRGITELFGAVDWGIKNDVTGSFTVFAIGGMNYETGKFQIVYFKKFTEPDPLIVLKEIAYTGRKFGIEAFIVDYGAGHWANALLQSMVSQIVYPAQYAQIHLRIKFKEDAALYQINRTKSLMDLFNQIKFGRFHFPRWVRTAEVKEHFTCIFAEVSKDSKGNDVIIFNHPDGTQDDMAHAVNILFAVLRDRIDPDGTYFPIFVR